MAYAEETKVPLERSIAEIVDMVRRAGAEQIGQMETPGRYLVMFTLGGRNIRFTVPLVTEYAGPASHGNNRPVDRDRWIEQRNRQKGRALKIVIQAKLESIESGVETFEEAFLAHIVTATGATVYERVSGTLAVEYETGKVAPLFLEGPRS